MLLKFTFLKNVIFDKKVLSMIRSVNKITQFFNDLFENTLNVFKNILFIYTKVL